MSIAIHKPFYYVMWHKMWCKMKQDIQREKNGGTWFYPIDWIMKSAAFTHEMKQDHMLK